ncbi:hypothetical protein [Paenibacillus campi]|uniref:hypothetical protein n=1 Tax=Paenibacillus campi TaxID=3106031 RepID=UPI002AFF3C6E|nr:hypothetical protein [Paenibacillus sp. SGZ-1009]
MRNYYPPERRHGYEVYTNHTCYNLWTAAALAYAIHCGAELEMIAAYPTPAQCTSYTLDTDGWFQTVVSVVAGQQLVWHTALNDPYNIPGLSRIHRTGMPGLIGPSAAGYREQGFTRFAEGDLFPLIHAPAWQTMDGTGHQLADGIRTSIPFDCDAGVDPADGGGSYTIVDIEQDEQLTKFTLEWSGPLPAGVRRIRACYEQRPGIICVNYHLTDADESNIRQLGAWIPLFMYDGKQSAAVELVGNASSSERVELYEQACIAEHEGAKSELPERAEPSIHTIRLCYTHGLLAVSRLTAESTFTFPVEARHVASRNGLLTGMRLESGVGGRLAIGYEIRLGDDEVLF